MFRSLVVEQLEPRLLAYAADIFVDGGAGLSRFVPPAIKSLGLSYEALLTTNVARTRAAFAGNAADPNGVLLDDAGQPEYRVIFINGGSATRHGYALGAAGRARIAEFVSAGGSLLGSCAGAFLASEGKNYTGVWPGKVSCCGGRGYQTATFSADTEFGAYLQSRGVPLVIPNIRHLGGPIFRESNPHPEETQFVGRITSGIGRGTPYLIWYQAEGAGRVGMQPGHAEYASSGPKLQLMGALLTYAIDRSRLDPVAVDAVFAELT